MTTNNKKSTAKGNQNEAVSSQTEDSNVATQEFDYNDPQAVIEKYRDSFKESEKLVFRKDDGMLIDKSKCSTQERGDKTVYITKDVAPSKIQLGENGVKFSKWTKKEAVNEDHPVMVEGQEVLSWLEAKIIYVKDKKVMEGVVRRLIPEKPAKKELIPAEGHLLFVKEISNEGADLGQGKTPRIVYSVFEPFKREKHNHTIEVDGKAWGQIGSTGQGRHDEAYELIKKHPLFGAEIGLYPKSRISLTRGVILIDEARLSTQPLKNGPKTFSDIPGFRSQPVKVFHSTPGDIVGKVIEGELWNPVDEYNTEMAARKAAAETAKGENQTEDAKEEVK